MSWFQYFLSKIIPLQRIFYQELSRGEIILNPSLSLNNSTGISFLEIERIALGEKILEKNYAPIAQEYLKKGCPRSLRSKMWTLILGAEIKQHVSTDFVI